LYNFKYNTDILSLEHQFSSLLTLRHLEHSKRYKIREEKSHLVNKLLLGENERMKLCVVFIHACTVMLEHKLQKCEFIPMGLMYEGTICA
jgi:hypothetical protein